VAARRTSNGSGSSTPFAGLTFLVSGFQGDELLPERQKVGRLIQELGGIVADACPPAASVAAAAAAGSSSGSRQGRRQQLQQQQGDVHAVVSDAERNTPKYLFACATGLPVYTAAWLDACASAGRLLGPADFSSKQAATCILRPGDQQLQRHPGSRLLAGLRVLLHGSARWRTVFADVVHYAGGSIVQQLEAPPAAAAQQAPGAAADLIIVNDGRSQPASQQQQSPATAAAAKQVEGLRRRAARLGVPVTEVGRMCEGILHGDVPDAVREAVQKRRQQQQQQQAGSSDGSRKRKSAQAAADGGRQQGGSGGQKRQKQSLDAGRGQKQQQQQQRQRTPPPLSAAARGASRSPVLGAAVAAAAAAPPAAAAAVAFMRAGSVPAALLQTHAAAVEFAWLPQEAAAGGGGGALAAQQAAAGLLSPAAAAARFRTFHHGFTLSLTPPQQQRRVQRVVRCGDCVLLPPLPGEGELPRVVQLLVLWQETPADGVVRRLGRGRRLYRPSETQLGGALAEPQLFLSDHYEERLSLAAVLDRCEVAFVPAGGGPDAAGGQAQRAGADGQQAFVCSCWYDHIGGLHFRMLTPAELVGGGA
jgi:hypothetical protein